MTCFCCSVNFEDANSLRSHYIPEHDVDENNHFFVSFLIEIERLCRENISVANISAQMEEKRKNIIFFCITSRAAGCLLKTSL